MATVTLLCYLKIRLITVVDYLDYLGNRLLTPTCHSSSEGQFHKFTEGNNSSLLASKEWCRGQKQHIFCQKVFFSLFILLICFNNIEPSHRSLHLAADMKS